VEVSVSDTGVGFVAEDQEKVFEKFPRWGRQIRRLRSAGCGLDVHVCDPGASRRVALHRTRHRRSGPARPVQSPRSLMRPAERTTASPISRNEHLGGRWLAGFSRT
jgi:hypothetical protein